MKKFSLLLAFLCCFMVFHVNGATYHWNGTDSDWNTLTNWKVGTATSNATMLALPDATALPGNGDDIWIRYTQNSTMPKLSSTLSISHLIIVGAGKSLDLNGFNLNVVGVTNNSTSLCLLTSEGQLINSSTTTSAFSINPGLISNTRSTTMTIASSFRFGEALSQNNFSVYIKTNNSGSSISITQAEFHVPCEIHVPNMTISANTFHKNLSIRKDAGSGSAPISYINANDYHGEVVFTVGNYSNINLMVGDAGTASNFYGGKLTLDNKSAITTTLRLSANNFVFHNPCELVGAGFTSSVTNFTFNANVSIKSVFNGVFTVTTSTFNANLNFNNSSGSIALNNCTYNSSLITLQGTGTNTLNGGTIANNMLIQSTTTAGTTAFSAVTFNGLATLESTGSGTIAIGNPVFAPGKKIVIGNAGFSAGVLTCSGNWSSVDSPISLGLTGTSALVLNGLTLNQALTATAPSMQIVGGGTYNENVALTVQNNLSAYYNWSGATFEKDFQITVQGTGQVKVARTSNAVFKGNVSAGFANISVLQFGLQSATTPYTCDFYKDVSFSNTSGSTIPLVLLNAKFIGTTLQTLSATAPLDLANVVINNAAGVQWNSSTFFRISSLTGLTAKVIFTMGKLINNTPYPILFIQNTSWEGASQDSYIVGGVGKYQFTNGLEYVFPLGDVDGYAPISMIPNYTGIANANSLCVNYYRTAPSSLNMGTAKDISECEYWRFKTYHIIPTVAPVGPNPAHQFTFNLFWDGLRNCTPANLDIMGMARYTGTSWNQTASNIEQPEANKLKMVGTEVFHAVHTANEMLVTYAYKSVVKLDVSSVSASAAELVCNFDQQQLTGGQTTMPKIHPNFNEVVTLTIQGDADSEPLGLKIPMSAEGNPVVVNMLDNSPLNPALYKITGNTVKFFNEPTDETVYEDYVINNGNGLPYTNATNIDITVAAGMTPVSLKVYRPNGTLFSENATISGQRIYSPTFNTNQIPNGSGTFILKVRNAYNEDIDIQGHYILSR